LVVNVHMLHFKHIKKMLLLPRNTGAGKSSFLSIGVFYSG
jgi:predicted GTPase